MAYTAIETMRRKNQERFGSDLGPMQPPLYTNRRARNDLKSAALRFCTTAVRICALMRSRKRRKTKAAPIRA